MKGKGSLTDKVGTVYVATPKDQASRDRQSKEDLRKSGGTGLKRGKANLAADEKAERASYKLNRKDRF